MTRPADIDARIAESGFTLLELLVVLALLALAMAVAVPMTRGARAGLELRAAAYELASGMRSARAAASRANREIALRIDVARREFWAEGHAPRRALAPRFGLDLAVPDSERLGPAAGQIRFFPDGSSSGGRLVLSDGRREAEVAVDWLSGAVRVRWN